MIVSVLEVDLLIRSAEVVAAIVERYEQPLPLHQLNRGELEALAAQMHSTLAMFAAIRHSAGLIETPGWLTLMATEYGCVKDALHALEEPGFMRTPTVACAVSDCVEVAS